MPELPEVETVKEVLKRKLIGYKITRVMVFHEKTVLSPLNSFESSIINSNITDITRLGKFLIIHFENKNVLIVHLRMEGKFIECQQNEDISKYSTVVFYLNDGRKMCFDDTRKFGIMIVSKEETYLNEEPISKLGLEPFDIKDSSYLLYKYSHIKRPIKEVMLDQSIIAGIGNIYADETLFRCKLHPLTPANELTNDDCKNIIKHSIDVLNKAIELGGSTIKSYHAEKGIDGKFQNELLAYGKEGNNCFNKCGARYRKIFVNGRGTTYCPLCQRRKDKTFIIGVTGVIASGKSTIIKYFNNNNIKVISSDEIVKNLYNEKQVQKRVISLLGKEAYINENVNKEYIKKVISLNQKLKTSLEEILHPLVREKLKEFINNNYKEKIIVLEIPLLYESKMEDLVDATMAIDASLEDQKNNLLKRGSDINSSILLNSSNQFKKYRNKVTFLFETNNNIDTLYSKLDTIIKQF